MSILGNVGKAISSFFGGAGTRPTSNTQPNGGDGVQAYAGWLTPNERRSELVAPTKWLTFANAHHTAIVATGLRYRCNLLAGAKWHAEANPRGGRDAERAVEIVTEGLLNAQLERPWQLCVRKASMFQVNGFSLFEWSVKRRADDMIVFSDLGHRPPHTIQRWDKPSEQESWRAVAQLSRQGNQFVIPRERLWYCWDDTLTDMPDGVGLMRHVIELVRRLGVLEGLEGFAYETDVRGMPIGRAPIEELRNMATSQLGAGADAGKVKAFIADRTANLRSNLENIIKSPEKLQWLMLDSATYKSADQNSVTAVQKWAFDLLRGEASGLTELDKVIGRLQLEIARVFGIEFVMMGGTSSGSKAMHADKTSMLAASLNAALAEIGASATRDLARPLVGLNGLDPDTCTPTLVAEPIDQTDVLQTCQALQAMSAAGLAPSDPARNVIRGWLSLPDEPEPSPEMLGAMPPAAPPDPKAGEVDVPVDDLGAQGGPAEGVAKFDPDQPRDDHDRWGSGGGGHVDPAAAKEYDPETGVRRNEAGALGFNGDSPATIWAHQSGMARRLEASRTSVSGFTHVPDPNSAVMQYIQDPSQFNQDARSGNVTEKVAALDREIESHVVPEAVTVYRGVRSGPLTSADVGDTVHDAGFMSTTPTERRAVGFATGSSKPGEGERRPTVVEFDIPKGTHATWTSDFETEMLLGRGYGLKVTAVGSKKIRGKDVRVLRAELVPPSSAHASSSRSGGPQETNANAR